MSIIFFRFFLLFSVVANSVGVQDSAPSGLLADSHQLSTLAFATKILYEIMLVRIFCNFSFFFTQFFWLMESSPNLCVNSSSSYISPSMLPLSSGDLIEWSLVCHSILSYQRFYDLHSIHYDHLEGLHQLI